MHTLIVSLMLVLHSQSAHHDWDRQGFVVKSISLARAVSSLLVNWRIFLCNLYFFLCGSYSNVDLSTILWGIIRFFIIFGIVLDDFSSAFRENALVIIENLICESSRVVYSSDYLSLWRLRWWIKQKFDI